VKANRLRTAQKRISRFPYRHHATDDAYAQFIKDGTLPADLTLSAAVMYRVLKARKPDPEIEAWRRDLIARGRLRQPIGCTREMFFAEACSEQKWLRDFARNILRVIVQAGHDPTDPDMIGYELEPDDHAPVCMRVLGYPHDFVRPEYQAQMERVQRQRNRVSDMRPHHEEWDRGARKAVAAFLKRGEIPTDPLYYLYALTVGETFALVGHFGGKGGEELLAAYEAVATCTDAERAGALKSLGQLHAQAAEARHQ
jgi:hypothetical protein